MSDKVVLLINNAVRFKSVSANLEAQMRMSVALPWESWIPLRSQHLGAPTPFYCLLSLRT